MIAYTIARKDLRLLFTDKVAVFFTFVFPVLFAVLFGAMMGGGGTPRRINLAVVVEDTHADAQAFFEVLNKAPELNVTVLNLQDAQEQVRQGKLTAWLRLPDGFGKAWAQPFGAPPNVELGVDPARTAEAGLLQGVLMRYGAERMKKMFSAEGFQALANNGLNTIEDPNLPAEWRQALGDFLPKVKELLAKNPPPANGIGSAGGPSLDPLTVTLQDVVVNKKGPQNVYSVLFPQAIVWGSLGCLMAFGASLAQERTQGTLQRLLSAPIQLGAVLRGKALACALALLMVNGVMLLLGKLVFRIPMDNAVMLLIAVPAVAAAFAGMMVLLAAIAQTEQAVNGMGWAVFMVLGMIGGLMVPLFLLPELLQTLSHISPLKWAIVALEGALWRQFSLRDMLLPVGILLSIGAVCGGLGALRLKRTALS